MSVSTETEEETLNLVSSEDIEVSKSGDTLSLVLSDNIKEQLGINFRKVVSTEVTKTSFQTLSVGYPTGFTKDNCFIVSFKEYTYNNGTVSTIRHEYGVSDSAGTGFNWISYGDDAIQFSLNHNISEVSDSVTIKLELLLMKFDS